MPDAGSPARFLSGTHAFGQARTLISDDGTVVDVPAENLQQAFRWVPALALPGELDNLQKDRTSQRDRRTAQNRDGRCRSHDDGRPVRSRAAAVGLTTREDIAARKEINPITAGVSESLPDMSPGGALSAVGKGATAVVARSIEAGSHGRTDRDLGGRTRGRVGDRGHSSNPER